MKIRIDETEHEGSGSEIMEQLRQMSFDPDEYPDTASYIRQLRENFVRSTGIDCELPNADAERQALALIAVLEKAGALEVLTDGPA